MQILPTQALREVSVKSTLAEDTLLFKRLQCSEALGRMYTFDLELASTRSAGDGR